MVSSQAEASVSKRANTIIIVTEDDELRANITQTIRDRLRVPEEAITAKKWAIFIYISIIIYLLLFIYISIWAILALQKHVVIILRRVRSQT